MLYAHNDKAGWGVDFISAARELKIDAVTFDDHRDVPVGSKVFIRMSQQPHEWDLCNRIVGDLRAKDCQTLPSGYEIDTYDDKLAQFDVLSNYMPKTGHFVDKEDAFNFAATLRFPIISKAKGGASSANIRLLNNMAELECEIKQIFDQDGFPISYGRKQKGYILLQEFIAGNDCDYRIIINGRFAYGLIRGVRDDKPFASGSGRNQPITDWSGRSGLALAFCDHIHRDVLNADWLAYDVVFDSDDKPYLLETSCAWKKEGYYDCPALMSDGSDVWIPSEYTGRNMFKFAVEILHGEEIL